MCLFEDDSDSNIIHLNPSRHMLPGKKLPTDECAVSMLSNIDTLGILMWVLDEEVPLTPPKRSPGEDFIRVDIESESSSVTSINVKPVTQVQGLRLQGVATGWRVRE